MDFPIFSFVSWSVIEIPFVFKITLLFIVISKTSNIQNIQKSYIQKYFKYYAFRNLLFISSEFPRLLFVHLEIPLIIILTFTIMFWFLWRSERFKIHGSDNKVIKDSGFMDFPVFLMPHQIMCVVVLCWNENVNSLTDTLNYSPKNTTSFFNFVKFPNRLYLKKHFPLNFSLEWGFLSKKVCVYVRPPKDQFFSYLWASL